MAAVREIIGFSPYESLDDLPAEQWKGALEVKANAIATAFNTDLSCAINIFRDIDAHKAWKILGLSRTEFLCRCCEVEAEAFLEIFKLYPRFEGRGFRPRTRREIWDQTQPVAKPGEIGRGRNRGYRITSNFQRGTSSAYRLAQLKAKAQNDPETAKIAEQWIAGEIKTVKEAARAAQLLHDPSILDRIRILWVKASKEERDIFLEEIQALKPSPAATSPFKRSNWTP